MNQKFRRLKSIYVVCTNYIWLCKCERSHSYWPAYMTFSKCLGSISLCTYSSYIILSYISNERSFNLLLFFSQSRKIYYKIATQNALLIHKNMKDKKKVMMSQTNLLSNLAVICWKVAIDVWSYFINTNKKKIDGPIRNL